ELAALYEYATPIERLYLLLALNCGFGIGEIATLRTSQVNLDKRYIRRKRGKTGVLGFWRLWPEIVAALRWYLSGRPKSDSPYLILTDKGTPLVEKTKGGNRKQVIPNAWGRLFKRVKKDHPAFPDVSFNKLRKTGASFMRRHFGENVAERYL